MTQTPPTGAHGFDFFFGDWRVRHSRLKRRLVAGVADVSDELEASVAEV